MTEVGAAVEVEGVRDRRPIGVPEVTAEVVAAVVVKVEVETIAGPKVGAREVEVPEAKVLKKRVKVVLKARVGAGAGIKVRKNC